MGVLFGIFLSQYLGSAIFYLIDMADVGGSSSLMFLESNSFQMVKQLEKANKRWCIFQVGVFPSPMAEPATQIFNCSLSLVTHTHSNRNI